MRVAMTRALALLLAGCVTVVSENAARPFAQQVVPADEHVERVFPSSICSEVTHPSLVVTTLMAGPTGSVGKDVEHDCAVVISDKSVVFTGGEIGESGIPGGVPPPVRIAFADVASVEVGYVLLDRWVTVRTKDGRSSLFRVLGPYRPDQQRTQAAGDLLRSKLQVLGH